MLPTLAFLLTLVCPSLKCCCSFQDFWGRIGRLSLPWALFAYPFYLWQRSPGKTGSHYDPSCDLFVPAEKPLVSCRHSNEG